MSEIVDERPHGSTRTGRFALGLLLGALVLPVAILCAPLAGAFSPVVALLLGVGALVTPAASGYRTAGVLTGIAATMALQLHWMLVIAATGGDW